MGFFDLFKKAKKEEQKKDKPKKKAADVSAPAVGGSFVDPKTGQLMGKPEKTAKAAPKKAGKATGNAFRVLVRPIISEKASNLNFLNQYFFVVDKRAGKQDVKRAVEAVYDTEVISVRTMNFSGKARKQGRTSGRTNAWKKAIVTLAKGQKIEVFEGK